MKYSVVLFLMLFVVLTGCDSPTKPLASRESAPTAGPEKPTDGDRNPQGIDKEEKFRSLGFQEQTGDPSKFTNIMSLDLTAHEQAWFTFTLAPKIDGAFLFSIKNVNLTLDCTGEGSKQFSRRIYWQEYTAEDRRVIGELLRPTAVFEYQAGKLYALTYALTDLKKDFPKCQSGTVRLGVFE